MKRVDKNKNLYKTINEEIAILKKEKDVDEDVVHFNETINDLDNVLFLSIKNDFEKRFGNFYAYIETKENELDLNDDIKLKLRKIKSNLEETSEGDFNIEDVFNLAESSFEESEYKFKNSINQELFNTLNECEKTAKDTFGTVIEIENNSKQTTRDEISNDIFKEFKNSEKRPITQMFKDVAMEISDCRNQIKISHRHKKLNKNYSYYWIIYSACILISIILCLFVLFYIGGK